jgi:kinesin family member 22
VSKKKTGRAYVALARAHSEKGNLQVALDLYRKAETYVPDNVKLRERYVLPLYILRYSLFHLLPLLLNACTLLMTLTCLYYRIIEIEWAVNNNTEFIPSPKKPRKHKQPKLKKDKSSRQRQDHHRTASAMDEDEVATSLNQFQGSSLQGSSLDFGIGSMLHGGGYETPKRGGSASKRRREESQELSEEEQGGVEVKRQKGDVDGADRVVIIESDIDEDEEMVQSSTASPTRTRTVAMIA